MARNAGEDESPASPDPILPPNLEDASVTELIDYLDQLKMKLIQMNGQQTKCADSNIPVIPLNLQVSESQSTANINMIHSSDTPDSLPCDTNDSAYDDEEEELRKIAMQSLKPREIERTPAVRSPSPMSLSPLPEDELELQLVHNQGGNTFDSDYNANAIAAEDDELQFLRLQVLSTFQKNSLNASSSNSPVPQLIQASSSDDSHSTTNNGSNSLSPGRVVPITLPAIKTGPIVQPVAPKSKYTQEPIIINFGNDSSSSSDSECDDESQAQKTCHSGSTKSSIEKSGIKGEDPRNIKVNLNKLTTVEKREYLVLKDQIEKLDALINIDAPQLAQSESEYRKLKKSVLENKKKLMSAKSDLHKKRQQLLSAQQHARKMQELYMAASKVVSQTATLMKQAVHTVNVKVNEIEEMDKQTKDCLDKCLQFGRKIEGDTYSKPSIKPLNRTVKLEKRKKKLEDRQIALLKLVAKRNEEEAEAKKREEERRKAEENLRKNKEDLTELISDFTKNDISKSILLISHMKDICNTGLFYPDMLGTFFGRDHLPKQKQPCSSQLQPNQSNNSFRPLTLAPRQQVACRATCSSTDYSLPNEYDYDEENKKSSCPLLCLSSFRLNKYFESISGDSATSDLYCNRIEPSKVFCTSELVNGKCDSKECSMQHSSSYILSEIDKLVDIISFSPSIAAVREEEVNANPGTKEYYAVRSKMENFAKRFKQDQEFNCVAGQLITLVRDQTKDKSPLEITRCKIPPILQSSSTCSILHPVSNLNPKNLKIGLKMSTKKKKPFPLARGPNKGAIIRKRYTKKVKGKWCSVDFPFRKQINWFVSVIYALV